LSIRHGLWLSGDDKKKCNILSGSLLPTPFSSWFWSSPSPSTDTCDMSNMNVLALYNAYRTYVGLPTTPWNSQTMPPSGIGVGYCDWVWQDTLTSHTNGWLNSLYSIPTTGSVVLNGLNNWVPNSVIASSSTGNRADSSVTHASAMWMCGLLLLPLMFVLL